MGIIKQKLFDDVVPVTARIFRELAVGLNGYGYNEIVFHRVVLAPVAEVTTSTRNFFL